ncbi:MAG: sugar ABC transporter ATP-binding protein [Anaerolineae bacterium]|nr:sugar ABC transporter ATP-binding protein [Anaerolineae bacterium]
MNTATPIATTPVVQLKDITKSFGGVHALKGVHLNLYAGEVHAILGENGAGKSTLIKVITGVHQPSSGEIYLNNELVEFANPRDAQQLGIAAIYQEPSLFPDLSIAENILVGRQPTTRGRISWQAMNKSAKDLLKRLGVDLDPRTKARNLTVAQQQMVEIARALSVNAKVLIMDEPTSSLTSGEVEELFRITRNLREEGTAIAFISHRLEELFAIADRVTTLRDGTYIGTREMASVTTAELINMMVGRDLDDLFPKLDITPGEVVLEVENLTVPNKFADISFELRAGEILGMSGLVGAGRTEVAQTIFGVDTPQSGTIKIDGAAVSIPNPRTAMQLGIGYVPEDRKQHGLVLEMPITDNITLPSLDEYTTFGWLNEKEARESAEKSAVQFEIKASSVNQLTGQLSGGNQQKVVLAKWLARQPHILILDEPTRGIDVGTKATVHHLMGSLAAQGMAILMISSELPEILGMSDRILVMREGQLIREFSRAEATQEKLMMAATGTAESSAEDSAE